MSKENDKNTPPTHRRKRGFGQGQMPREDRHTYPPFQNQDPTIETLNVRGRKSEFLTFNNDGYRYVLEESGEVRVYNNRREPQLINHSRLKFLESSIKKSDNPIAQDFYNRTRHLLRDRYPDLFKDG